MFTGQESVPKLPCVWISLVKAHSMPLLEWNVILRDIRSSSIPANRIQQAQSYAAVYCTAKVLKREAGSVDGMLGNIHLEKLKPQIQDEQAVALHDSCSCSFLFLKKHALLIWGLPSPSFMPRIFSINTHYNNYRTHFVKASPCAGLFLLTFTLHNNKNTKH